MTIAARLERLNSKSALLSSNTSFSLKKTEIEENSENTDDGNKEETEIPKSAQEQPTKESGREEVIKSKRFWRTRIPFPSDCQSFFVMVKPEKAEKGTRYVLLFQKPFYAILNESKSELEMISPHARFYLEGRFIYIKTDEKEQGYSIKADLNHFSELINNKSTDLMLQFFRSIQLTKHIPLYVFVTKHYYNQILYNPRFFLLFSELPLDKLTPEVMQNWIHAVDPFLCDVFDSIIINYFNKQGYESKSLSDEFVLRAINAALEIDDSFKNFRDQLLKAKKTDEGFFVGIELSRFNDRSKMVLHLLYYAIIKNTNDSEKANSFLTSIILNSIADYYTAKNINSKAELIRAMIDPQKRNIKPELQNKFQRILTGFINQPSGYTPAKKGAAATDGFTFLIKIAGANAGTIIHLIEKQVGKTT